MVRDPAGRLTGLTFLQKSATAPAPLLTKDVVERSQAGRVLTETVDNATAPTSSFGYDSAGRLKTATVPDPQASSTQTLVYTYDLSTSCGTPATAGRNGNRVAVCRNGGAPTTYSYDGADRLTSSSDVAVGTPAYDAHGNTTTSAPRRSATTPPTGT